MNIKTKMENTINLRDINDKWLVSVNWESDIDKEAKINYTIISKVIEFWEIKIITKEIKTNGYTKRLNNPL